jgi:hypothetical protein
MVSYKKKSEIFLMHNIWLVKILNHASMSVRSLASELTRGLV